MEQTGLASGLVVRGYQVKRLPLEVQCCERATRTINCIWDILHGEIDKVDSLLLRNYNPQYELIVPEHQVLRARFPAVDAHTHLRMTDPRAAGTDWGQVAATMDKGNVKAVVDLNAGWGETPWGKPRCSGSSVSRAVFVPFTASTLQISAHLAGCPVPSISFGDIKAGARGIKPLWEGERTVKTVRVLADLARPQPR